jgi:hypothetical protein
MRRTVSMDDVFNGEAQKPTKMETTASEGTMSTVSSPRVLYKLPSGARSATSILSTSTKASMDTPGIQELEHKVTPSEASDKDKRRQRSMSMDSSISSSPLASPTSNSPTAPKKRTLGRLIEALSAQFRAKSSADETASGRRRASEDRITPAMSLIMSNRVSTVTEKLNDMARRSQEEQYRNYPKSTAHEKSGGTCVEKGNTTACQSHTVGHRHQKSESASGMQNFNLSVKQSAGQSQPINKVVNGGTSHGKSEPSNTPSSTSGSTSDTARLPSALTSKRRTRSTKRRVRFEPEVMMLDAARTGETALVRASLENNVSPDYQSAHRRLSALHLAASYDHLDICRLLIENGASLNIRDLEGWTPLHCAAAEGHLRVVNYLLSHRGVDVTLHNVDGETAEDVAEEERVRKVLHAAIAAATAVKR